MIRDGDQRYEDSKWLISTPLSLNDPWNPKVIKFNFSFPGSSPPFHPDILYTEGIGRLKRTH